MVPILLYLALDLETRRTIDGGHERGGLYFLNTSPPIDARALSASVSPLQWHCRLGHSSLPTLQKVLPIKSSRLAYVTFFESTPYYSPNSSLTIPHTSVPLPVPTLTIPPHTEPPTQPLQVYFRCNRSTNTTLTASPSLPPTAAPGNPSAIYCSSESPNYRAFSVSLSSVSIPNTYHEALRHPAWKMAMDDEMSALISRGTWELVEVPLNTNVVACRWVFTLKFRADGTLERRIIGEFGFLRCQADHSVFVQTTTSGMVVLAVYVDDILITGSDIVGIEEAKTYLQKHFVTKDLGRPRPDISFAVGLVSQFMDKPRSVHWEAALRILKYIKASPSKGLLFKRHGHVKIETYSDADYAGAKDDRKSTSGYCTYVGGNLVT
ncbi:UNVERIFIED_CONTAM: Retrovirus-related Pol polyprotein from transposon RE1 [Sesamum angustifolium]|uniref:Retrovirus-related Pol polyprotein from transposon RE1 n=1 Tax=Sesamum angustifolium TaxID=2727405 RepID=A0AAW2NHQ2_9LAMI